MRNNWYNLIIFPIFGFVFLRGYNEIISNSKHVFELDDDPDLNN